jgi:hypothetical protein
MQTRRRVSEVPGKFKGKISRLMNEECRDIFIQVGNI